MHVVINGENKIITESITVADLLKELQLKGKLAIELNQQIIPRSEHHQTELQTGDQIEIVQAIGGG